MPHRFIGGTLTLWLAIVLVCALEKDPHRSPPEPKVQAQTVSAMVPDYRVNASPREEDEPSQRVSLRPEEAPIAPDALRRWAETDGASAFGYADSLADGAFKEQALTIVAEVLARSNPVLLGNLLAKRPGAHENLIHLLADIWSRADLPSALAWAQNLTADAGRDDALAALCPQWVAQAPEAAAWEVSRLPEGSATAGLVSTVATHWGSSDPTRGIAWSDTLPEAERALAISTLLGAWAQRDAQAAGNYVSQLTPGDIQDEAARAVVTSWAAQAPQAAAAWVLEFPAGPVQAQALRQVINDWNNRAPADVQDWAVHLPEGETRDSVLKYLVETLAYTGPTRAAEVADLIQSPDERQLSLESLVRSWSETDPAAARTWVAALEPNDPSKSRLQSLLP